jgi:sporulation protein YlmC with PRC-barrel domain
VAADGQTIGKLADLVIERQSGIVDYVLVSGNATVGAPQSPQALPWNAIANLMTEHAVVLGVDEKQLTAAPMFISK